MLLRSEFAIEFNLPHDVPMIGLLRPFPPLEAAMRAPDVLLAEHVGSPEDGGTVTPVPFEVDHAGVPVPLPPGGNAAH